MRVIINPLTITTENGDVVCSEYEVSVAISNSVAVRLVPVGLDGTEYPEYASGIVGDASQADINDFIVNVTSALTALVSGRQ